MGLFGALFTGVSGLAAESQSTSIIANNIANTNTVGFKRSSTAFSSLVTSQSSAGAFSPGTVSVTRVQQVDEQGSLQQTSSATDAAISGNGFFPVKRAADDLQSFLYTRAGSFSEDSQGLLRNSSGFVLYAWPIDQDGNLPADQGDLSSLVAADVQFLGGLTRPTTSAELAVNLNATAENVQTVNIPDAGASGTALPLPDSQSPSFSRGLTVFDSLGTAQTIDLEYRKITGPMANITSQNGVTVESTDSIVDNLSGIDGGDAIEIQMDIAGGGGANTLVIEFLANEGDATTVVPAVDETVVGVYTMQDMIDAIQSFTFQDNGGANIDGIEARLTANGQMRLQAEHLDADFAINNRVGTPATGGSGTFNFAGAAALPINVNPTDIDTAYPDQDSDFPDLIDGNTPNTQGWWELKIRLPNGNILSEGVLNFDGDGGLNASSDASGFIDIELNNIDWGNGSTPQDININIERFSQFAGNFDVIFSDQNGAELGLRTGIEITEEGRVVAQFSNGATADLYQIPLVTFSNVNGLNEVSGTAYSETESSGEENLREAGAGGAGFFEPSTVEGSNVDLADEFARLIVSQRTFSANSRVVATIDELTQDLLQLT